MTQKKKGLLRRAKDKLVKRIAKSLFEAVSGSNEQTVTSNFNWSMDTQPSTTPSDGNEEGVLVDFRSDRFSGGNVVASNPSYDSGTASADSVLSKKVKISPKAALVELGRRPKNSDLAGLDQKITMLELKRGMITQQYASAELDALIQCLKNRKRYDERMRSGRTYREFFDQFDATDEVKVQALLAKYDLVMKDADIFIPELPDVAAVALSEVIAATKELCKKKPRVYVIATADQFRDANGKRDPILLVQSPFGFYYYIIGAWDVEMQYLGEL